MKSQKRTSLIGKINDVKTDTFGDALYFRPFAEDDRAIAEIAAQTGEKKSRVAQRLIRLALEGKKFEHNPNENIISKLDWLVARERARALDDNTAEVVSPEKLDEIESLLETLSETVMAFQKLGAESYCLAAVSASYLNQIFTKLIEYLSPVAVERENSADFANRNALALIEHSIAELAKLSAHHEIAAALPEELYLAAKIESLRARLRPAKEGE